MKTYAEVRKEFGDRLPKWYGEMLHDLICETLIKEGKLHACSLLREASQSKISKMTVAEAKNLCEFIVEGRAKTDGELLAYKFSAWAWGKSIPTDDLKLEEFFNRFLKEQNINIHIL